MDYLLNRGWDFDKKYKDFKVLNLIINGLPSKLHWIEFNQYKY